MTLGKLRSSGAGTDGGRAVEVAGKLCACLLVAAAFALGITKIEDSDAWTHLALGREIIRHGGFPPHEPFTFPSAGMPFYNMEWLFQIVLYLGYATGGVGAVILVKAALAALVLLILWKDSRLPGRDDAAALMIRTGVLLGCLLLIRPRLVERPDLALMVFLSFTIYALNAYLHRGSRHLYWLPALQVLWANVQPSMLVGMVPFVAVLGGGLILRLVQRLRGLEVAGCPSVTQLKTVAAVFGAVLAASLVNPYGPEALTPPLRFATSVWHSQYIVELQPPDPIQQPWPFVVTALIAGALIASGRRVPVMAVLLVAPFVVLALSARRFSYILAVVAAPLLARSLVAFADQLESRVGRRGLQALAAGGALTAIASIVLALVNTGPFADSRRLPGFGVNELFLPERALRYLDEAGIKGRIFNTFHWGGYVAWRDFPNRLPIIDGRAHVEPALLWEIRFARQDSDLLEQLRSRYRFDVALIAYPARDKAEPNAFASPHWALVYWDDVALVYVRRSTELAALIERDEYRSVDPTRGVDGVVPRLPGGAASIEAEIRRSLSQTPSSIAHMLLGFVRLQAGAYDEAIEEFARVRGYSTIVDAAQGLAMAHWRKGDVVEAVNHYRRLVSAYPTPIMLYNLGLALTHVGEYGEAASHLERARRHDPQFAAVYPVLMHSYHRLGRSDRAEALARGHATALAHGQAESHVQAARRLARERKFHEAAVELETSLRLNPRNSEALSQLGEVYLEQGRLDDAVNRQRAALGLDPKLAQAHYGLARVYERLGDPVSARRHFERYLRLEPASYRAWTVRRALSQPPPTGRQASEQ
ncbi:MAG TPA: tetratricopeptide repeat protein [Methylomirabilota bacterium]|nr:tetratricopeptide repeat protein [Methylomirabilota bacterium]